MPEYRRAFVAGATFFFTVVTNFRKPILRGPQAVEALRFAFADVRRNHPFDIDATVILPDHLHCIWTMPPDDDDFAMRWRLIKGQFTRRYLQRGGSETALSQSRRRHNERGVWQRRYWEHLIHDDQDLDMHMDYIHYNPVKHGLAECPHHWPFSSFNKWVERGAYEPDWCCACRRRTAKIPSFAAIEDQVGEPI
ncbi:MAG: transposase [Planctomycetes bacterium]|nr:transposase [Planctomycetota bacterium]